MERRPLRYQDQFLLVPTGFLLLYIAPDKSDFVLFLHKYMLWALIKSVSVGRF